jgi:hypothetical protein
MYERTHRMPPCHRMDRQSERTDPDASKTASPKRRRTPDHRNQGISERSHAPRPRLRQWPRHGRSTCHHAVTSSGCGPAQHRQQQVRGEVDAPDDVARLAACLDDLGLPPDAAGDHRCLLASSATPARPAATDLLRSAVAHRKGCPVAVPSPGSTPDRAPGPQPTSLRSDPVPRGVSRSAARSAVSGGAGPFAGGWSPCKRPATSTRSSRLTTPDADRRGNIRATRGRTAPPNDAHNCPGLWAIAAFEAHEPDDVEEPTDPDEPAEPDEPTDPGRTRASGRAVSTPSMRRLARTRVRRRTARHDR